MVAATQQMQDVTFGILALNVRRACRIASRLSSHTPTRHTPACCRFIGHKPGDPTVGELPSSELPPAPEGCKVIRLSEWSTQQLLQEAATTLSRDPFADLLPDPPGVLPSAALLNIVRGVGALACVCL